MTNTEFLSQISRFDVIIGDVEYQDIDIFDLEMMEKICMKFYYMEMDLGLVARILSCKIAISHEDYQAADKIKTEILALY